MLSVVSNVCVIFILYSFNYFFIHLIINLNVSIMKKLFTLIALLTCFLGAKAAQIVDSEVDFSKVADASAIHWYSWGGSGREKFDIQDGCLHFTQDERTADDWGVQVFPLGDITTVAGMTYYLELKIKGNGIQTDKEGNEIGNAIHNVNLQVGNANHDKYNAIPVTGDFEVVTVEYACTADGTGNLLFQCGSWVGEFWIEYMKIWHEGKEQKPVEWENVLINGDASAEWANPNAQSIGNEYDGEGAELISAYSKEFGVNDNNPHAAKIEDGVFVVNTVAVDPPIVWDSDGEQWGQKHSAGDPKPDNEWQNQFWINFPRALKAGEKVRLSFDYKASEDARAATQDHGPGGPGAYLGGGSVGDITFTTEWQTFTKEYSAADGAHSLAFNLGVNKQYEKDITFYFDNLKLEFEVLEEGFFATALDVNKTVLYDFDESVKFEYDEGEDIYTAIVGGESEDEWVNQVMISTKRGTDAGYKANTIKIDGPVVNSEEAWPKYSESANAKIDFPVRGQWQITIDATSSQINFIKLVGEEDKPVLDVVANTTEVTLHGLAQVAAAWDNQFWIAANRALKKGEKLYLKFDYKASEDIVVNTQSHGKDAAGNPTNYISHGLLGDLNFTTEYQTYEQVITITDDDTWSVCFNMANNKESDVDYTITNVVWMNEAKTERLVDPNDEGIFWLKVGAGTPVQYPAVPLPAPRPNANGDKDADGKDIIDVSDIDFVIEYIDQEVNEENAGADTNRDGKIDVADIDTVIEAIK